MRGGSGSSNLLRRRVASLLARFPCTMTIPAPSPSRPVGENAKTWRAAVAWLAPISLLLWPTFQWTHGARRLEYLLLYPIILGLFAMVPRGRRLFWGLYPIAAVGIFFELQPRLRGPVVAANVHLCDLRALESRVFGFGLGGGQTLHDWLQQHRWLPLDVIASIPYGTYLFAAIGAVIWLYWRDEGRMRIFSWCFLALNFMAFITYRLYPAAPPWYFHTHGCVVDPAAVPDPGPNLAAVDQWLGFRYFAGLYSRSPNVYAAMPSLHVSYPMMILLGFWRSSGRALRALCIVYVVWMCSAAVYLDHHWVLDIALGLSYALLAFVTFRPLVDRFTNPPAPAAPAGPAPPASALG